MLSSAHIDVCACDVDGLFDVFVLVVDDVGGGFVGEGFLWFSGFSWCQIILHHQHLDQNINPKQNTTITKMLSTMLL